MKLKKVELIPADKPLLLVVDPMPTLPLILRATLRRVGYEAEIAAFQQAEQAVFWLSGTMDQQRAEKYVYTSPWDEYPALRCPKLAIVSLGIPTGEREGVLDWLYCRFKEAPIMTTSTYEELLGQEDRWDEVYWHQVVSHLPRPITVESVVERVVAALRP